ncbi:Lamin-like protein [Carex littledalei]|uniref:Lamin-like protein n=1 Tax=Carex littledalei TaxID=544730 RepID=A0A833VD05_9POAL|nr:Lamin-like protein [Carex littledalei]
MVTWRCVIGAATIAFFSLAITIPVVSAAAPPPVNKNHTVGEAAGWFFNTSSNAASANYSDWAASQNFYLGDFLIFKTNTNSSVVQTNNETTYNLCDASSDDGNQTFLWGSDGGDSNSSSPTPQVVEIPLVYEGSNYFFSDTMEGAQCQKGMKFGINVVHGNGLPPAFNQPPPAPYTTPPPPMTTGGGGGPSQDQSSPKNGVEGMQGGMVWTCLVLLSLGLMAV